MTSVDMHETSAVPARETASAQRRDMTVASLVVTVGRSPADFAEWPRTDRLGEARCHVFQCADILDIWIDTIGRARSISVHCVGVHDAAGRPVMLLALGIERKRGVRVLGFLDGSVSDYCQPVLFPPSADIDPGMAGEIWARIRTALPPFDIAVLDKMPPEVGDLPNPLIHLGAVLMPEAGHVMSLHGSRAEVEGRIPASKRHKRYQRQLMKERTVSFSAAATTDMANVYFDAMVVNKTRRFAETRVPGFELPGKLEFFREATRRLPQLAPVHLSAVQADAEIIASHWGLVMGDRFYFLMTAYADGTWRKFSPGRILNDELILWCHANGYRWFDFGIGNEDYKYEYCDVTIPLYEARIPVTWLGRLSLRAGAFLAWLRTLTVWQKLRPYKWALMRRFAKKPD